MRQPLRILYRGPLASCNYGCTYCPFAKQVDSREELAADYAALDRFVSWVGERGEPTAVLFTPWGEALIRRPYQDALIALSNMAHVEVAAIQTNLSMELDWVSECVADRLGIWATYHPDWTERGRFVARVAGLFAAGVRVSVGVVGFKHLADEIAALRDELPDGVYLWINAYKREPDYYQPDDIAAFEAIDPLFRLNTVHHPSAGLSCRAGVSVISVDGDGTMRRCHFIREPIGNIYDPDHRQALGERPCSNQTCGCHIGYVHLDSLGLHEVFGRGILERIPARPLWRIGQSGQSGQGPGQRG